MNDYRILHGDALTMLRTLPAASVQCIVTSPPYYGLRNYGVDDQIGLEPTVEAYVARLVAVFEECRRVLRDDGTLFLNLGDSYANIGHPKGSPGSGKAAYASQEGQDWKWTKCKGSLGLKHKDLIGIPWRVAFALQAAGWWLRADIIWAKRAPMPESVTDRPTRSHEHIFLLTKKATYFYDSEAVREPMADGSAERYAYSFGGAKNEHLKETDKPTAVVGMRDVTTGRNQRDVWLLSPEPYPQAHFATFPTEIPRRAILAGTSEKGCCPKCGAPWRRVVERTTAKAESRAQSFGRSGPVAQHVIPGQSAAQHREGRDEGVSVATTTGWQPTCHCCASYPDANLDTDDPAFVPFDAVPCTVLDPFAGSGTTLAVAVGLGRHAIGIELNAEYIELAERRIAKVQRPLALEGEL